jgi:iron complex outermembrane receptor protein
MTSTIKNKFPLERDKLEKKLILKRSVVAVALTLVVSHVALAQQLASEQNVTKVIVTGSNLKRASKEGASPVDVITAKDIKASGANTVAELLRKVPSMGTDTNRDFESGSGFARGVATASLRGLSSTSTLILLNGRRLAPSAYADPNDGNSTLYDLNSIPLSAIDRVEILKDGASAVYGSDAIGGVINFITRSDFRGVEVAARYGANDDKLFVSKGANLIAGKGDINADGYNVFITADVSQRDRVARRDVTDIEYQRYVDLNGRFRSNYSSSVSSHPAFYRETLPGSKNFGVTVANAPSRLIFKTDCDPSQQVTGGTKDGILPTSVLIGRTFCNYDADRFLEGQGAGKDASVLSRGEFKLSQTTSVFAEAAYTRSQRDYTGAPITIGQGSTTNFTSAGVGVPFQAILPIGHPDNPFPNDRASVGYRFENLRGGSTVINDAGRVLAGLKGTNFSWDWESAVLWNRTKKEETSYGRLYLPTLRKLNTGTTLAQLAADPTIGHDVVTNGYSEITQFDGKAATEFGHLPGGAMGLALGFELRQEKVKLDPDELVARGDIFGLANTIIDGQRRVNSAFIELRTPLLKNFEMEFAGRADKYPGIKTNFVPKVGAKWTVSDSLAIRSTYSEGFRAPALVQVTPGGAQFFLQNLYDPKRCETDESTPKPNATAADCLKSASGSGGFNPDLKPETSKSYSLGFIFSPSSQFDVLVDFYKIRKEGEIALGSAFDALKNEDQVPGNVVRDQNPANFVTDANGKPIPGTGILLSVKEPWVNQGATEVQGVDFEFRLRNKLGQYGALATTLRATYIQKYLIAQSEGAVENNLAGSRAGIYDWALSSGIDNPKWKTTLSTNWTYGEHSVNASINYVGPISLLRVKDGDTTYAQPFCYYGTRKSTDAVPNRNTTIPLYEAYYPTCDVHSWTTVGLAYTYTGIKNLTLGINIQNLLDTKAPYDPNQPLTGYSAGLHNNTGRYFNVSARYAF